MRDCHNWKTSQARFASDEDVHYYTPEAVIDLARHHAIRCISRTYNDPVVWQEFVLNTSQLTKTAGLSTLYESAFFPQALTLRA